jgi:acyl-CoA hydrolase
MMTNKSTVAQSVEIVFPEHCNHYGTLFGGQALLLLSKAAFVAATQFAEQSVVMAAVSDVQFVQPVAQGSMLTLRAWVSRAGRSSMTVCVHAHSRQPNSGETLALQALFEMVAVDAAGKPQRIASSFAVNGVPTA